MASTHNSDSGSYTTKKPGAQSGKPSGPPLMRQQKKVPVEAAVFKDLASGSPDSVDTAMNFVEDVSLTIVAEIGRAPMTLGQLMELKPGQVISLDKMAGEPSELFINGHAIAKAEVIVLDDNFGLRIQEIVPVSERVRQR